jgi:hypothetical protein
MTPADRDTPRTLVAILASLHPWLRARVSSITVWPRLDGGWDAQLSYLTHTSPPPSDCHIPHGNAEYPGDSHHALDLPLEQPQPTLMEQVRELEATGHVGRLHIRAFPEAAVLPATGGTPSCALPAPAGWLISTHADEHERQAWLRRMGRKPVPGAGKR